MGIHGDDPHGKPGLEGIAGMQCFDGVHRLLVAFRPQVRGVGDGRGKLAAQTSEDFAAAGGGGVGVGGVEGHGARWFLLG